MPQNSREQTDPSSSDALNDPLALLSIELGRISAEIQSINSGFQVQMQQSMAKMRGTLENQHQSELEQSLRELREQIVIEVRQDFQEKLQAELERHNRHKTEVEKEIMRVHGLLEGVASDIAAMLEDPSIELSRLMRLRTEQAELKSYLEGLRFAIGGKPALSEFTI